MQISLLLLHYNNYYNRTYKRKDSVSQYVSEDPYESEIFSYVNFVPGDGVNTSVILGYGANPDGEFATGCDYDYCVAYDAHTSAIVSRWFIMQEERTRQGQHELKLKRDLVADFYECCLDSTAFVEKGWLSTGNKLIYNSESMEVSEIKVNETFLSDRTNTPWLVAYAAKNAIQSDKRIVIPGADQGDVIDVAISDIANFVLYPYSAGTDLRVRPNTMTQTNAHAYFNAYCTPYGGGYVRSLDLGANRVGAFNDRAPTSGTNMYTASYDYYSRAASQLNSLSNSIKDAIFTAAVSNNLIDAVTQTEFDNYRNTYDGKTIRLTNGRLYSISFRTTASTTKSSRVTSSQYQATFNAMGNAAQALKNSSPAYITWYGDGYPNDYAFEFDFTPSAAYVVDIAEVQANEISATLKTTHRATEDAVYDIYCAPYWNFSWKIHSTGSYYGTVNQSADDSMNIMLSLKEALGSSLYDIQVVPYCPLRDFMGTPSVSSVLVEQSDEDKAYALFKDNNNTVIAGLFYSKMSQFEFNITRTISVPQLGGQYGIPTLTAAENIKLVEGTTKYRLVSPNYNGQFEFSIAKNNGVSSFNVDCTYKPFSPYIHVNPAFRNMYGQDWNDARGLICGGDFSLSQVSDAFTEYALQNKNYQEIFDRQIQNMDVNNSIARTEAVWGAVAGGIKGTAGGAAAGAMVGGVPGAIIGGVAGAAASTLGGIADYELLKQRQEEARDFAIDMYGYNLANVKAIPYSLTKVGAINGNNKLFPFVETYYATDEEMAAFAKKVKADGMTIMAVGTMNELCIANSALTGEKKMFKGQIVRFDDSQHPLKADAHLAEALNAELMKGVYF